MACTRPNLRPGNEAANRLDLATLFVSLELSKSKWLITSLLRDDEKMSKHTIAGGDWEALLALLAKLRTRAAARYSRPLKIEAIHEAGLDGFSVHRMLEANGVESHIVDPASIAVSRRARRAKTDRIDGETLLRTLTAWIRGEPRVCSMVVPPSLEEEDLRQLSRERKPLVKERIEHVNRIKGLLSAQGIRGFEPLRWNRQERFDALRTPDGRPLPRHLKAEIIREFERIDIVNRQIADVEAARDALLQSASGPHSKIEGTAEATSKSSAELLMQLKGIGAETASVLSLEGFYRTFDNRRQLAAYTGLAPSPWQSGQVDRDQGISKAGNPRLRTAMIELAWLWQRYQPGSTLSRWFHERVGAERGRIRRIAIVAMARKLIVALWRFVTHGIVPEGAVLKAA
jgi:transposase